MGATGGFGVTVSVGDGVLSTTPDYTPVAMLEDVGAFGGSAVLDEITPHNAPGGFRQKLATGLMEIDDLELTLTHDLTQATQANAAGGFLYHWVNRIERAYKFTFPDGMNIEMNAFVAGWKVNIVKDKAMRSTVKLTVNGQPVIS